MSGKVKTSVCIMSLMHMLVDGLCVCLLYLEAVNHGRNEVMQIFMLYNLAAFLTQPLTGWGADVLKARHKFAFLSVTALAVSTLSVTLNVAGRLPSEYYLAPGVAVILGLGNSLFHVWAGRSVTILTKNDMRYGGVFVSTGALGLALGMVFPTMLLAWIMLFSIAMLAWVSVTCGFEESGSSRSGDTLRGVMQRHLSENDYAGISSYTALILVTMIGLMSIVALRSVVGNVLGESLPKGDGYILLTGAVAMGGKAIGGWIARRLGIVRCLMMAMVVTLLCWWLGNDMPMLSLIGLLLINVTMPITLYLANIVLQGREGLSFGLLAAALIPGYLMAMA